VGRQLAVNSWQKIKNKNQLFANNTQFAVKKHSATTNPKFYNPVTITLQPNNLVTL
jgi:hypothetical protein